MTKRTTIQLDPEVRAGVELARAQVRPAISLNLTINHLIVEALTQRGLWPYRPPQTGEARDGWAAMADNPDRGVAEHNARSKATPSAAPLELVITSLMQDQREIESVLAAALGYPVGDVADPDCPCPGQPIIGDHTAVTLAMEAAAEITRLRSVVEQRGLIVLDDDTTGRMLSDYNARRGHGDV